MKVKIKRSYRHDKPCKDHLGKRYPNINQCVLTGGYSPKHMQGVEMYMV